MKEYFDLQFKMINRKLKDTGFEPLVAYIILTLAFIGLSVYLFHNTEFAAYIYSLCALTLTSKLTESRRTEFLQICFGERKMKKIRFTENLIITAPFLIFLTCKHLFLSAFILLILTTMLAIVSIRTTFNLTIPTPFSKKPFEFTTGFRNTFYFFLAAYALTLVAVSVNNFNLGIFAMLLVFVTTLSYYKNPENDYYVWTYNLNPKIFLIEKIKTAIRFSSSLAFPIALIMAVFFHQNIGILLLFFLVGWAFLVCMILGKYAAYPDELNITQAVLLTLCIFFPPLLIILIPYLFLKSEKRLRSLLK